MAVSPRSDLVSLIDDFIRVKRGRGSGTDSPRPILILEGIGGSGRSRVLDDTFRRWKGKTPLAKVNPPVGGEDSMRYVLRAVMLGLTAGARGYRISFPRVVLAHIAMTDPIDDPDPEQSVRLMHERINTYRDPGLVVDLLNGSLSLAAGNFGLDTQQLEKTLQVMTKRLSRSHWRSRLLWQDALSWFTHQDRGRHNDPIRALIWLSQRAGDTDPGVRKDVDELLMGALLADLRAGFHRAVNHPSRAVVLLDSGDAPSAGQFLTTLVEVRAKLARHDVPQDPLIVIAASDGYHLAKAVGVDNRAAQWSESELADLSEADLDDVGPWLRVRLDGFTAVAVEDMVKEDVTQWRVPGGSDKIVSAVMRLTGGHAMATDLVLARLRKNPELVDDLGRVLSEPAPNSMAGSLIDTIAADLSPQQGLHEQLKEALITLAGARDGEEAQCLKPLLDDTVRDEQILFTSSSLWSVSQGERSEGPWEMAPFVRFLLLRELAARPAGHPASWTSVFKKLHEHTAAQDVCAGLHHGLALGNHETVVTELVELLDQVSDAEWLECLGRIVATPGLWSPPSETDPADASAKPRSEPVRVDAPVEPRREAVAKLVTATHQLADPLLNRKALKERYVNAANACGRLADGRSGAFRERQKHLEKLGIVPEAAIRTPPRMRRPGPASTDDGRTYVWRVWPDPDRFPKRRRHWWRPTAVVATLVLLAPGVKIGIPWLSDRFSCGWQPVSGVWEQDGDCVGVSQGPYAFNRAELADVMSKIAQQNEGIRYTAEQGKVTPHKVSCSPQPRAVTIGALMTLTSAGNGGRALHELEGIAAAQASANMEDPCAHPIRLLVAEMGSREQAAVEVAELLADQGVVAVIGMGLSLQQTADAAQALGRRGIPMVANLVTAEGFDRNGSKQDKPDYGRCDPSHTYKNGIGQQYFYRVAHRNAVQIEQLARYLEPYKRTLKFIMTPITMDDPYTCTTLPLVHAKFDPKSRPLQEVRFDPEDEVTVKQSAQRICASAGEITVFYAARAYHLPQFLKTIAEQFENGQCRFTRITVVSTSDAARMRAGDVDEHLERQRLAALSSPAFLDGTIRLVYTPLADPDVLAANRGMVTLREWFTNLGFDAAHLNSGWAIAGFDGMTTVVTAVRSLSRKSEVTPARVASALGNFVRGGAVVVGASGNITFDNSGNRDDSAPSVMRLCPAVGDAEPGAVQVYPTETTCP